MANLKAIKDRTRTARADLGDGDVLNVTYRPAAYTPAYEADAKAALNAGDRNVLARMVVDVVADWDLYEDEAAKSKVAIDVDTVNHLPILVISAVMEAIGRDLRPNPTSGEASGGGSME